MPVWPSGEEIEPRVRKVKTLHKWKKKHDIIEEQIKIYTGDCLEIENTDKTHLVTKQPKQEDIARAKVAIREWEEEIQSDEEGGQAVKDRRDKVTTIINLIKGEIYGGATPREIQESTEDWTGKLQQWIGLRVAEGHAQDEHREGDAIPRGILQHGPVLEDPDTGAAREIRGPVR